MPTTPTIMTPPRRKRRKRGSAQVTPAAPLNLVAAQFFDDDPTVELTFDRAINIDALAASAVEVNDDLVTGELFQGTDGAGLINPNKLALPLVAVGGSEGGQVRLTVTAQSGIVAVDDGGTWAGVTDLVLPFP